MTLIYMIKDDLISDDPPDLRYENSIINDEKLDFSSPETLVIINSLSQKMYLKY